MNAPVLMAIGAFLLVFGLLFALFSGSMIGELYSSSYYNNYQIATAYSQLIGLIVAAMGASFLAYGYGMNSKSPLQSQQSA
jgi:amino acid transporter